MLAAEGERREAFILRQTVPIGRAPLTCLERLEAAAFGPPGCL